MATFEAFCDLGDVKRALGNEDDIGSAGDTAIQGDPSRIAAHHLDHDHTVMGLRGGVYAIDRLRGYAYRGVKAKTEIGSAQIVVDGLGHGNDLDAARVEFQRDRLGIVATDGDKRVNAVLVEVDDALLQAVLFFGGIGSRGAQNCAATR